MTPREANVLLTKAALLDGRLRREPEERAQMAIAWAEVLADVSLADAVAALEMHYREQTRSVMPADIVAVVDDAPVIPEERVDDVRAWLTDRGVDADAFLARVASGEAPRRVLRELGAAS